MENPNRNGARETGMSKRAGQGFRNRARRRRSARRRCRNSRDGYSSSPCSPTGCQATRAATRIQAPTPVARSWGLNPASGPSVERYGWILPDKPCGPYAIACSVLQLPSAFWYFPACAKSLMLYAAILINVASFCAVPHYLSIPSATGRQRKAGTDGARMYDRRRT